MKDMPKHPRLVRRNGVYYHRAAIPADIKDTYPKAEETFSLRTRDPREAVILVRKAAAEVDERFEAHRRLLRAQAAPLPELTEEQLKLIEERYFVHLLEEDEETRLAGFFDEDEPLPKTRVPSFEEYQEMNADADHYARHFFRRGKADEFFLDEAAEVLTWDGIELVLAPKSPSWKRAALALQRAAIRASEAIARRNQGNIVDTPVVTLDAPKPSRVPLASQVRKDWIAEKARGAWVPKTRREHEVWSQAFLDLVGDKPISDYNKVDARAFKKALQQLPANWSKHPSLRGLSFPFATEKAEKLSLPPMSDRNVNKILNFVGAMWMWAARNYEEVTINPFKGLQIPIKKRARDERDPFNDNQLRAIFNAPIYRGCRSHEAWSHPGQLVLNDSGRFWVPLISLFSGARLGEIVQLETGNVREQDGIVFLDVQDEGEGQRLKTINSRRRIPVHPQLVAIGLLDLVEARRKQGEKRLFPDLKLGQDGYYSSPFSKFFRRFLESVGAKTDKTSFHSFRHNFEDACRNAKMPEGIMNALQGHGETGMAARYGQGYSLEVLDEEMRSVEYKGLDLSHLTRGSG